MGIRNLRHMVDMVTKSKDQYLRWDLSQDDCVIVDRQKAFDITPECLRVNMIGADRHLLDPLPPPVPMKESRKGSIADDTGTEVDNTMDGGLAKSKPKKKRKRLTEATDGDESEEDAKSVPKRGRPRKSPNDTAEDTDGPKASRSTAKARRANGSPFRDPFGSKVRGWLASSSAGLINVYIL